MKPILLDFPSEFTTERLLIRMPLPGDGKAVHHAIKNSRNELEPWLPFARNEQTEEQLEENIREAHAKFLLRKDLRFHVYHRETGEFIASTGLHRINWDVPKFEIGYWIDSRYSGKGYVTETVEGLTQFAFEKLGARRVEIRMDTRNIKSKAVPERLGFTLEGILRQDDLAVDGSGVRDTYVYSKIRLT
ncbi:GNAT family N-acetyltransferase [Bacillus pinisoli]|uniref:GNAT family N-acetyltransferase n=1 Tax=Bacillus pinisoli TaxID=2901866 RepID=UPI001FF2E608|nr:GNAT family N-acetyltransferase [Bacillus pinisoli]